MTAFEIVIYETSKGREPFNDWLNSLDVSLRGRVMARIDRLEGGQFGNAKALKDGLFELKINSPALRIYYAMIGKQVVLLISGGNKTFQSDDIKKAKRYLEDYRSHGENKKK